MGSLGRCGTRGSVLVCFHPCRAAVPASPSAYPPAHPDSLGPGFPLARLSLVFSAYSSPVVVFSQHRTAILSHLKKGKKPKTFFLCFLFQKHSLCFPFALRPAPGKLPEPSMSSSFLITKPPYSGFTLQKLLSRSACNVPDVKSSGCSVVLMASAPSEQ